MLSEFARFPKNYKIISRYPTDPCTKVPKLVVHVWGFRSRPSPVTCVISALGR
jgi:hypothetical protein